MKPNIADLEKVIASSIARNINCCPFCERKLEPNDFGGAVEVITDDVVEWIEANPELLGGE